MICTNSLFQLGYCFSPPKGAGQLLREIMMGLGETGDLGLGEAFHPQIPSPEEPKHLLKTTKPHH